MCIIFRAQGHIYSSSLPTATRFFGMAHNRNQLYYRHNGSDGGGNGDGSGRGRPSFDDNLGVGNVNNAFEQLTGLGPVVQLGLALNGANQQSNLQTCGQSNGQQQQQGASTPLKGIEMLSNLLTQRNSTFSGGAGLTQASQGVHNLSGALSSAGQLATNTSATLGANTARAITDDLEFQRLQRLQQVGVIKGLYQEPPQQIADVETHTKDQDRKLDAMNTTLTAVVEGLGVDASQPANLGKRAAPKQTARSPPKRTPSASTTSVATIEAASDGAGDFFDSREEAGIAHGPNLIWGGPHRVVQTREFYEETSQRVTIDETHTKDQGRRYEYNVDGFSD